MANVADLFHGFAGPFAKCVPLQCPCSLPPLPAGAVQLVLDCFPDRQQALLQQLGAQPEQQFAYLKCVVAMHQQQAGQEEAAPAAAAPLRAGAKSPGLGALLRESGVANLYLRLLCQYEPRSGGARGLHPGLVRSGTGSPIGCNCLLLP